MTTRAGGVARAITAGLLDTGANVVGVNRPRARAEALAAQEGLLEEADALGETSAQCQRTLATSLRGAAAHACGRIND